MLTLATCICNREVKEVKLGNRVRKEEKFSERNMIKFDKTIAQYQGHDI